MDLYHTTSGAKMKQKIAQRYPVRLDLAQTKVATLPLPFEPERVAHIPYLRL
jgi:hypothetical protein